MRALFAVAMFAVSVTPVFAVDAPQPALKPSLVRGTVESFDGKILKIKTDAGEELSTAVVPKTRFSTVEARSYSQLKPTDFIGVTAVPGRDGHLRAEEVHVIPVVGMGEGQYAWDHHPATSTSGMGSMTNGTIAPAPGGPAMGGSMTNGTVMAGGGAHELNVTYHGASMVDGKCAGRAVPGQAGCTGTAIIDVPPTAVIVAIVAGTPADVKPGLAVFAGVLTDVSGYHILASATLEKNGVKPEF
jgi:hypothetical protein